VTHTRKLENNPEQGLKNAFSVKEAAPPSRNSKTGGEFWPGFSFGGK
jgi:hypothetical protein